MKPNEHIDDDGAGGFPRRLHFFLQRDKISGWKFCQVRDAIEFHTGVLFLKEVSSRK